LENYLEDRVIPLIMCIQMHSTIARVAYTSLFEDSHLNIVDISMFIEEG